MNVSLQIESFKKAHNFLSNIPIKTVNVLLLKIESQRLTLLYTDREQILCVMVLLLTSSSLQEGECLTALLPHLPTFTQELHHYKQELKGPCTLDARGGSLFFNGHPLSQVLEPIGPFTMDFHSHSDLLEQYSHYDKWSESQLDQYQPIHKLLKVCNKGFSLSRHPSSSLAFFTTLIGEHITERADLFLTEARLPPLRPIIDEVKSKKNRNPIPCIGFAFIRYQPDPPLPRVKRDFSYIKENLQ